MTSFEHFIINTRERIKNLKFNEKKDLIERKIKLLDKKLMAPEIFMKIPSKREEKRSNSELKVTQKKLQT